MCLWNWFDMTVVILALIDLIVAHLLADDKQGYNNMLVFRM